MSFVQGVAFNTSSSSGSSNTSITGVTANNGLFAFLFFNGATAPGITGIVDSASATTWAVSGSPIAMPNNGTSIVVLAPTNAVVAGTHTLTVSYTGGFNYWTAYVEDTLNTLHAAAVGRVIETPGAGQTLTPGANIGNSGDLVYMLALDTAASGATNKPVAGTGGFTIPLTNVIAGDAAWSIGYNASAGGTTPSMAPGTGGASDETGVIAFALQASGGGSPALMGQICM